jgi:hypothetical protein
MATFAAANVPNAAAPEVVRIAQRFGFVAAVGHLATEWQILPWARGAAAGAVKHAFDLAMSARGTVGTRQHHEALENVRSYIRSYRHSRFVWHTSGKLRNPDIKLIQVDGYIGEADTGEIEYQFPDRIPAAVCKPFSEGVIIEALDKIGALDRDGRHQKRKRKLPEYPGNPRCYVVKHSILFPEDN